MERSCSECGGTIGRRVFDNGRNTHCRLCAHRIYPEWARRQDEHYDQLGIHDGTAVERMAAAMSGRDGAAPRSTLADLVGQLAARIA
jgi:hypothetical protein